MNMKTGILPALLMGVSLAGAGFGATLAPTLAAAQESALERFVGDDPAEFATPDEALAAFRTAISSGDEGELAKLLGLDAQALQSVAGLKERIAEIGSDAEELLSMREEGDDVRLVLVGPDVWPFPFPVTKLDNGKWAFATYAGLEEVINRRVGQNELQAIATARAYVDAQQEYATLDHDGDGVLEYAQLLISTQGATDGLYWPAEQGDGESPAGPAIDDAALDKARQGEGYFGYRFKILKGQGDKIAGGAYDYVINGNMIGGFALLAWPAKYAESGVHSFVVNQAGIVYEKDLGPDTEKAAAAIEIFNPDESWTVSED